MKKYFSIYKEFFKTSISQILSFRLNFSIEIFMNLFFMGTFFFTTTFIFDHIEHIGFWNRTEFFFFLSFFFAIDQIHYVIFSHNFWEFSEDIRLGNLDFHLLKPAHSLFVIFTRYLAIPGLITSLLAFCLMIYFGWILQLSLISWIVLPLCILISLMLLFGIEILISLFNFITVEGMGINQARLQIQHIIRWPDFIYRKPFRLFMLPALATTSFPVRFLLNNQDWQWLFWMILGNVILWIFIFYIWEKSMKLYESPSS